jgi:AbrB family looped-hinge helix DNA binding protein
MIVKKIDDIGRVAIPKDYRKALHWVGGDEIAIDIDNDNGMITMKKFEPTFSKRLENLQDEFSEWLNAHGLTFDEIEDFAMLIQQVKELEAEN